MSFWSALVAIVAIVAFAITRVERYKAQNEGARRTPDAEPRVINPNPELLREVEDLRERVRVLERITTDNHQTLSISHEIESLRDKQPR